MKFLKEVKDEMQKTSWPSGKELRRDSGIIFSVLIFFSLFFFVADTVIVFLLNLV